MLRNMLLVFVALVLIRRSTVHSETILPALQFGKTTNDYIQFPADFMDNSASHQFSICTWVRKRRGFMAPHMLHYYTEGTSPAGIVMTDSGSQNRMGDYIESRSEGYVPPTELHLYYQNFWVPSRKWFHQCMTWSTADYTVRIYVNGEEAVFGETDRKLWTGGTMCLNNNVNNKNWNYIFGGDLYKLNIYGRVLEKSEIGVLASDMCSSAEDRLASSIILKWGDIIKKERAGNVTEFSTHCYTDLPGITKVVYALADIREEIENTKQELTEASNDLNSTKQELREKSNDLNSTVQELEERNKEMNSTNVDLVNTRRELAGRVVLTEQQEDVIKKREKNERLYQILTIVFGTLSVVLMLLLTTLLVKRVYVNRTD